MPSVFQILNILNSVNATRIIAINHILSDPTGPTYVHVQSQQVWNHKHTPNLPTLKNKGFGKAIFKGNQMVFRP